MVERRLREQQGEDSEHEEPESPQGMPGSPLKSAEMKPSYEERRAKMEQRWKQTLGVDHLPASPIEMGVGMVSRNAPQFPLPSSCMIARLSNQSFG